MRRCAKSRAVSGVVVVIALEGDVKLQLCWLAALSERSTARSEQTAQAQPIPDNYCVHYSPYTSHAFQTRVFTKCRIKRLHG